MLRIKGTNLVMEEIDLWVRRKEAMLVQEYRRLVWTTLYELVRTTPQWSGHAAANWNLGLDHPDNEVHDHSFEHLEYGALLGDEPPKQVGDQGAWRAVEQRYGGLHGQFMRGIQRRTKVYFSNGVYGDDKWGDDRHVLYLARYQNPSWHARLREVNQPYETAQEVVNRINRTWKYLSSSTGASAGVGFGRLGGYSVDPEFA